MTIHDPEFRGLYLQQLFEDLEIKPQNVVFEISEKLAIDNYDLFRGAMRDYTLPRGFCLPVPPVRSPISTGRCSSHCTAPPRSRVEDHNHFPRPAGFAGPAGSPV